jgi:hypothetical protein
MGASQYQPSVTPELFALNEMATHIRQCEQSDKEASDSELTQEAIHRTFQNQPRQSRLVFSMPKVQITVINGKCTGELEVQEKTGPAGDNLRVTSLERTLIDIVVRLIYSGGVQAVLNAYRLARERASTRRIWKYRESEITLRLFKVGWRGDRIAFGQLCEEFERSHFAGLAANTVRGHRTYMKHLKTFFGDRKLDNITVEMIEKYRDQRRQQPTKRVPNQKVKGATVNRELECLKCVLDLAVKRRYIPENPASSVKHFNELRERPVRRMLTVEEEQRILEAAPPHLRVAIVMLTQTGGRTYSEGFSLRWDQVDLSNQMIRLGNDVKTPGSSEPVPLSEYACEVLQAWKKEQVSNSPFLFPSPICPDRPISTVKTAWKPR